MVEARNNTSSPIITTSAEQFIAPQELVDQLTKAMEASCVKQIDAVVELPPQVSRRYQEILLDLLDKEAEVGYDLCYGIGGAFVITLSKVKPLTKNIRLLTREKFVGGLDD